MATLPERAIAHFTASPTEFHNVCNCAKLLPDDFVTLSERDLWEGKVKPGGKYIFTRNGSSLVAFAVGGSYDTANPGGLKVIAGHTDSPNLRIKPRSKRSGAGGITQLNIECYGGGLWHTWFDRDLSVAGKVIVRQSDGTFKEELVDLKKPICKIPNLCIHLQTGEERAAFKVNKEEHLQPMLCMAVKETLEKPAEKKQKTKDAWQEGHEPALLSMIASTLNIETSAIADFELSLYDTQPAALGGANDEFVYARGLDNQATCFTASVALAEYCQSEDFAKDTDISIITLFDHEEVGSASQVGAGCPILGDAVRRISAALNGGKGSEDFFQVIARKSFIFSIDMAHAIHPNYASKHEKNHAPGLNAGFVIKTNQNQRYSTNASTGFMVREIGRRKSIEIQEFVVRNDCPCGSTTGPILSSKTGIRTVDAGMPQLSMHSCRETMGTNDLQVGVDLFKGFFEMFKEIDECCVEYSCIPFTPGPGNALSKFAK